MITQAEWRLYMWDTSEKDSIFKDFINTERRFSSYSNAMTFVISMFRDYVYTLESIPNHFNSGMSSNYFVIIRFSHPEFPTKVHSEVYQLYIESRPE